MPGISAFQITIIKSNLQSRKNIRYRISLSSCGQRNHHLERGKTKPRSHQRYRSSIQYHLLPNRVLLLTYVRHISNLFCKTDANKDSHRAVDIMFMYHDILLVMRSYGYRSSERVRIDHQPSLRVLQSLTTSTLTSSTFDSCLLLSGTCCPWLEQRPKRQKTKVEKTHPKRFIKF